MPTAPAPIVKTELFALLAVNVSVPVFTVKAVVSVAFVTVSAAPVKAPTKPVAVTLPVEGLYVKLPSASKPTLPLPAAPATKVITLLSFSLSLSDTVTAVAIAAVPEVF